MTTDNPEKTPQWKDTTTQTPTERVDQTGLKMQGAGVTYSPKGLSEVAGHEVTNGARRRQCGRTYKPSLMRHHRRGRMRRQAAARRSGRKPQAIGIAGGTIYGQIGRPHEHARRYTQCREADTAATGRGDIAGAEAARPRQDAYQAFGAPTGDRQIRPIIYTKKYFMMPKYDVLYDVYFDGDGEFVGLVMPHHRVKIFGRNLLDLVTALRNDTVEWIREYVEAFHILPSDPYAPVITDIDIDSTRAPFQEELGDGKTDAPQSQ